MRIARGINAGRSGDLTRIDRDSATLPNPPEALYKFGFLPWLSASLAEGIRHIERKYRIENNHAVLKQHLRLMRVFQTLTGTKAALADTETFCANRKGQFENCETGVINELAFGAQQFKEAA